LPETAVEFSAHTSLSTDVLYADPTNSVGSALNQNNNFQKGVGLTFGFTPGLDSYVAVLERLKRDGALDLVRAFMRWKVWLPPPPPEDTGLGRFDLGMQQGGVLIFEGESLLFARADPSTASHANLEEVLAIATAT